VLRIQKFWQSGRRRQITDPRNLGLYVFMLIVLAIAWSTVKAIQANYDLQRKIAILKQQNTVTKLQNENTDLKNRYYNTDEYLNLAARQNLGVAAPGEKVLTVPHDVALKHVDMALLAKTITPRTVDKRSKIVKNLDDWKDFLLGRKLFQD
jgi:cell division protein FtsB